LWLEEAEVTTAIQVLQVPVGAFREEMRQIPMAAVRLAEVRRLEALVTAAVVVLVGLDSEEGNVHTL
jgi:6,7-dimethyl-8-ribityllumazine synthase